MSHPPFYGEGAEAKATNRDGSHLHNIMCLSVTGQEIRFEHLHRFDLDVSGFCDFYIWDKGDGGGCMGGMYEFHYLSKSTAFH